MAMVEFSLEGAVALIRLNRPPVNALSEDLAAELNGAFANAEEEDIRAVVVTGQPHFAAGADIKGFQQAYASAGEKHEERIARTLVEAIWRLERLEKPTIAAVFGYALGGGLELAMGADFRYLSDDAQVGQPEIKLGIIPGAGGTQRLPRLIGYQRAKEIIYSGRFVGAEEALGIGLADKVVAPGVLLERAMSDAALWADGPTRGYAAAKKSINNGWGRAMDSAMEVEASAFNECFWTDDAREGVRAFLAKRDPRFSGR